MFSKKELAEIKFDVEYTLRHVSLPHDQRKTRVSIVEKISSHNKQSESLLCPNCGSGSLANTLIGNGHRCQTCNHFWEE